MNRFVVLALFVALAFASSHSEAPGTAKTPQSDITDFYMFQCYEPGKEDHTCFILNMQPLQDPFGGPNYFSLSDDHFFEIYIDNDGDANEDITFQFFNGNSLRGDMIEVPFHSDEDDCHVDSRSMGPKPLTELVHGGVTLPIGDKDIAIPLKFFGPVVAGDDSNLNWDEWYQMNVIYGDRTFGNRMPIVNRANPSEPKFTKPFDYAGTKSFPAYDDYAKQYLYDIDIPGCDSPGRVFLGQRREAFHVSLGAIFDLINFIPIPGFPGAVNEDVDNNDLKNLNVDSFVLEVPTECLVKDGQDGVIGAWSGVRELHHDGEEHVPGKQTNRLGMPLVNEIFIGLVDKGEYNEMEPREDVGMVDTYIQYPTFPELVNILFKDAVNTVLGANLDTLAPTNIPRQDLNAIFMTGIDGINKPVSGVPAEMMRLNTSIPTTARELQSQFGVIGGDAAGYPNGRRPGDDVVDISIRAAMGVLCELSLFCVPEDAAVGDVEYTDGSPLSAMDVDGTFPYMTVPEPGSRGL